MNETKRILVVDDEPGIRDVLEMLLRRRGYQVTSCSDGTIALEAVRSSPRAYDLVLTDNAMPRMCGTELARTLRREGFKGPIVMLTADVRLLLNGATEEVSMLLSKPFDNATLLAEVKRLLAVDERLPS